MAVDAATREAQTELLREAYANLVTSDDFLRLLRVRASFRGYSFRNQLLIALQRPDATLVNGFKKWQTFGRQVQAGEHGIRIFAPCVYKVKEQNAAGEEIDRKVVKGFRLVSVFDVSQTAGDPLPEVAGLEDVTGDLPAGIFSSLYDYAVSLEYTIETRDERDEHLGRSGCGGYCDHEAKLIVLREGFAPAATIRVLVHELVHATGITYKDYGRADAEIITDAAACLVLQSIGLNSLESTAAYLASWSNADSERVSKWLEDASKVAGMVETGIGI